MRFRTAIAALILSTGIAAAQTTDAMLDAVRQVESGGRADAVSPKGAIGPYQFMRATWIDHAQGLPFARASVDADARIVARRYLDWIYATLTKWMGREPSDEQVLAAWNGGIGRLRKCGYDVSKMPRESREFARRVIHFSHQ